MNAHELRRKQMVERDIAGRGVSDERVLSAMREVPREAFVPAEFREQAYEDCPLPIGAGQTISQPYIVALMCEALRLQGTERVLEIGTGSGYAAAVLARLAEHVETIERFPMLAEQARVRLTEAGAGNVSVHCADGTLGWPQGAPFDAIVVTAAGPEVPPALQAQLSPGGRLVMPVENGQGWQELLRLTRVGDQEFRTEQLGDVAFVPLIGEQGWPER